MPAFFRDKKIQAQREHNQAVGAGNVAVTADPQGVVYDFQPLPGRERQQVHVQDLPEHPCVKEYVWDENCF